MGEFNIQCIEDQPAQIILLKIPEMPSKELFLVPLTMQPFTDHIQSNWEFRSKLDQRADFNNAVFN